MSKPADPTQEQLLLLYNHTSTLVFLIDVLGASRYRVASVNPAYIERTRIDPEDVVGRRLEDALPEEQAAYVTARYDEAVAHGAPWSYETRTTFGGETVYLDTTLVPVYDDCGRCTHLVGASREITENKRERQALQQEKQRAENYLDISEAVIVVLDLQGNVTRLNRKGYHMLGYPEGSLTGENWCERVIAPEKWEKFNSALQQTLETGEVGPNVNYVRTRTGERILISWANALIHDEDGNVTGILSSGEDITDRHRAEQAMIASQRLLAAEEVASAVAHDINNSLQGILGNIEIALAVADRPADLRRHLATASKLADDAAHRVKVLRGAAVRDDDGNFEPLDVHELIEDVIEQTQPLWKDEAQRHGHDVHLSRAFSRHLHQTLGNRSELRSVLYNVVKNSIEAIAGHGEVEFRTRFQNDHNIIEITDTGIGMDPDTSTRIFQPFFSTKGLESGRGLGMSASHGIVRAHGGDIRVKRSTPGAGTTIQIRLPALDETAGAPGRPPAGDAAPRHRILWVDDDAEIRTLAESYIAALGHRGDVTSSGARALELLAGNDYSVVITDVGMPGMTGLELAAHIRRLRAGRVPVVALTGWGEAVAENGELPEGVSRIVSKPIRLERLREILAQLPAEPAAAR